MATDTFTVPSATSPMPSSVNTNLDFGALTSPTNLQGTMSTPAVTPPADSGTQQALSYADTVKAEQAVLASSQAAQDSNALISEYKKSLGLDGGTSLEGRVAQTTQELEKERGLAEKNTKVTSLINQIKGLDFVTEADKQRILASPVGGLTSADLLGREEEINRNQRIKRLDLTAQLFASQGDVDSANAEIEKAVNYKYAGEAARLKNIKEFMTVNEQVLGREAVKQKAIADAKLKDLELKKAEETNISKMLVEAAQVAPKDVLARATDIKNNGGTALQVAAALGTYGGDYLKNELLRSQLRTEKAQRDKIYSDMAAKNTPATSIDGIIATLPKAQQDRYYKLQGDFDKATEKYRGAMDAAGSVKALSENATAQDQTAIIFQYMKTLDPSSTVREGEFALVASTAGLGDRAVNALKRLDNGQRLNEDQISDIVGATEKLAQNAKQNLSATAKEYDRRASLGGLPKGIFLASDSANLEDTYAEDALGKLEAASNYKPTARTFLQALTGN